MALNIDFAFEGFRVIRARPQLIPIWGLVLLVFYAGFFYLMATMMGPGVHRPAKPERRRRRGDQSGRCHGNLSAHHCRCTAS
ncbi:MAG: hypothetical protein WDN06_01545 [Asticcacaulis sp.]